MVITTGTHFNSNNTAYRFISICTDEEDPIEVCNLDTNKIEYISFEDVMNATLD